MRFGVKALLATLLLVSSLGAWALDGRLPPEEKAKALTDKLKVMLDLSEAQVSQVAAICLDSARKIDVIRKRRTVTQDENDADARDELLERDTKLKAVLDAKQWARYREKKEDLAKDMKAWAQERHSKER